MSPSANVCTAQIYIYVYLCIYIYYKLKSDMRLLTMSLRLAHVQITGQEITLGTLRGQQSATVSEIERDQL